MQGFGLFLFTVRGVVAVCGAVGKRSASACDVQGDCMDSVPPDLVLKDGAGKASLDANAKDDARSVKERRMGAVHVVKPVAGTAKGINLRPHYGGNGVTKGVECVDSVAGVELTSGASNSLTKRGGVEVVGEIDGDDEENLNEEVAVVLGDGLSDDDLDEFDLVPSPPPRAPVASLAAGGANVDDVGLVGAIGVAQAAPVAPLHGAKEKLGGGLKDKVEANVGHKGNAWASGSKKIFMNSGLGGKLSFTPPTSDRVEIKVNEGLPVQSVWGWSLLGQYVGYHPGHFLIQSMMKSWGVKCRYRVEEGWFVFQFDSEDARDNVLKGGPYFIHGRPMILKPIPEKFAFNRRDIATIPLWVRIFGLSRTFWTPEVLGRVASHVGKPLFMDPVTDSRKRGAYARVLVEINFVEPVKREVQLAFDDGEVLGCTFLIENEPKYCKGCCSFGHLEVECPFKEKKDKVGANAKRVPKATRVEGGVGQKGNMRMEKGAASTGPKSATDPVSSPSKGAPMVETNGAKDPAAGIGGVKGTKEKHHVSVEETSSAEEGEISGSDHEDGEMAAEDEATFCADSEEEPASCSREETSEASRDEANASPFVQVISRSQKKKEKQKEARATVLALEAVKIWPDQTRSLRSSTRAGVRKGKVSR
ncbi:hypothetical protein V2J09_017867 [Rumex salicifolius]